MTDPRYPYTHHGPAVHGSKLADYLISEHSLREDRPELFDDEDCPDPFANEDPAKFRRAPDWHDTLKIAGALALVLAPMLGLVVLLKGLM